MQKAALFLLELRSVNDDPGLVNHGLMLYVKHLVEHHVFDDIARDGRRIENAADVDGVACGVVTAENVTRSFGGPGQPWLLDRSGEVSSIHFLKQWIKVVVPSAWAMPAGCPASAAPGGACAFLDFAAEDEHPVVAVAFHTDFFPVELGEKDQRKGMHHLLGRVHEDIADADVELSLVEPGRVVQTGKWEVFDRDIRNSRAGLKLTMRCSENQF